MPILENLESYMDKDDKCHYCQNKAGFIDVAQIDKDSYAMVGICRCHLNMEASS